MARTFYSQLLNDYDWEGMVADAIFNGEQALREAFADGVEYDPEADIFDRSTRGYYDLDELRYGSTFLGTVFSVYPSGKYYTAWACSNITEKEAEVDEAFSEALDKVVDMFGFCVTEGEGDPCGMFIAVELSDETIAKVWKEYVESQEEGEDE